MKRYQQVKISKVEKLFILTICFTILLRKTGTVFKKQIHKHSNNTLSYVNEGMVFISLEKQAICWKEKY